MDPEDARGQGTTGSGQDGRRPLNGHDPDPGTWHDDDLGAFFWSGTGPTPRGEQAAHGPSGARMASAHGWTDLADIEDSDPEPSLVGLVAAEPGALTIAFGDGGQGKGTFSSEVVARVVAGGGMVGIVDAEGHPREWRRRLRDLMHDDPEPWAVSYWQHPGGELDLESVAGIFSLVVVDSAAYFRGRPEDHDEWAAAATHLQAQAVLAACPVLVLAHTSKATPGRAYGSTFWHNAARLTLEVTHEAVTCRKANDIADWWTGRTLAVDFAKDDHGRIERYTLTETVEETTEHKLRAYLEEWRTKDDVAEYMGVGARTAQTMLNGTLGLETMQADARSQKRWRVAR